MLKKQVELPIYVGKLNNCQVPATCIYVITVEFETCKGRVKLQYFHDLQRRSGCWAKLFVVGADAGSRQNETPPISGQFRHHCQISNSTFMRSKACELRYRICYYTRTNSRAC